MIISARGEEASFASPVSPAETRLALLRCHWFAPPIVLVEPRIGYLPWEFTLQTGEQAVGVTSVSWRTGPGSQSS